MEIFDNSEKISGNLNCTRIEELYRSLFDKLHGFVYCRIVYKNKLAQDFECILVNKTFETQIGQKNITGKTFSEIAPVLFKNERNLIERCAYIANSGLSESFETYLDSLQLWVLISIQCQELDHFILSFTIITDRKDKEKSIDILLRRYHSILEISSDGIHIIDKSGNLIEANESFCKMLGYTKNEVQYLNISDWDAKW
jgi:PAS domain-containing protein